MSAPLTIFSARIPFFSATFPQNSTIRIKAGSPLTPRNISKQEELAPPSPGRSLSQSYCFFVHGSRPRGLAALSSPRDRPDKVQGSPRFLPMPPCRPWGPQVQWPDALVLRKSFRRLRRLSKTYIGLRSVASICLSRSKALLFSSIVSTL
jgi:hypothetical protein